MKRTIFAFLVVLLCACNVMGQSNGNKRRTTTSKSSSTNTTRKSTSSTGSRTYSTSGSQQTQTIPYSMYTDEINSMYRTYKDDVDKIQKYVDEIVDWSNENTATGPYMAQGAYQCMYWFLSTFKSDVSNLYNLLIRDGRKAEASKLESDYDYILTQLDVIRIRYDLRNPPEMQHF